jgi:DNA-binding winged helix-turn-helix (wHTH) protein
MRLAFDEYAIDMARRELWRGTEPVAVEPQVFDLLLYLAQNPDRVIGRDELLRAVWNGRIVSDSAITNRIAAARRAIGDSGEMQRLIRTVSRRGIRFLGHVEHQAADGAARSMMPHRWRPIGTVAASALIGAAIAMVVAWTQIMSGLPKSRSETDALPRPLVSALPLKPPGTGADGPGLAAPAARDAVRGLDALPRSPGRVTAAIAKPSRDIAAAAPPAVPVLPAAPPPLAAPQAQKAPLPDVTVTTPAPIQQVNPINTFSGGTGIDEAKWSVIPCATARIDLGAGAKCQAGLPVGGGFCDIARHATMITTARYQIEADVKIVDPTKVTAVGSPGKNCTVWRGYTNMPDDFKDMNQMTRRGTAWANFVKGSPQSTASFVDGGRNCVAVERFGPPWHGGYVWVVHASICSAAGVAVQNADIDLVFAMLQLRTYDAQGNLRASLP